MKTIIMSCLIALSAGALSAQEPAAPATPKGTIISANPLGFLQFGPTLEAEFPAGQKAGIMLSVRMPSMGLVSHMLDDALESGWMVGGSVRLYANSERKPAGWFYGPRAEFGKTDSGTYTSSPWGVGFESGHRWIKANGFAISVGGMAGYLGSSSENKPGYDGEIASLKGVFLMGVINLGVALR